MAKKSILETAGTGRTSWGMTMPLIFPYAKKTKKKKKKKRGSAFFSVVSMMLERTIL